MRIKKNTLHLFLFRPTWTQILKRKEKLQKNVGQLGYKLLSWEFSCKQTWEWEREYIEPLNEPIFFQQYKGHTISWPPTVIVVWVLFATTTIFRKHTSLFLGKIRLLSFQDFVFLATNWVIHATFPANRCKIDPEVEKAKRIKELNQPSFWKTNWLI